jgi:hypothetical protein
MSKHTIDQYATEEETAALIRPDTRSDAQKRLDAMLDDLGAFEQGAEPYSVLYKITLKLLEEQGEKQPTGGNVISQMQRDEALLRQALEFMNELLPATSEISAEHLSDPTLLRDLELRDAIKERLS